MTLLIAVLAAIAASVAWYLDAPGKRWNFSVLCYLYWGASLMWFVDAIFEFAELGAGYFRPSASDMLNDAFLGVSAVTLGLVIWLAILFFKDPKGALRSR